MIAILSSFFYTAKPHNIICISNINFVHNNVRLEKVLDCVFSFSTETDKN